MRRRNIGFKIIGALGLLLVSSEALGLLEIGWVWATAPFWGTAFFVLSVVGLVTIPWRELGRDHPNAIFAFAFLLFMLIVILAT